MTRVRLLAAACLIASSCTRTPDPDTLEAARLALRTGSLDRARQLAGQGLTQTAASSDRQWEFRSVAAESLLAERRIPEAAAIVGDAPPSGTELAGRARSIREYLQARVAAAQRRAPEAIALLAAARQGLAPDDRLAWDIDIFDGQLRLQRGEWEPGESLLQSVRDRAAQATDRFYEATAAGNLGVSRYIRNRHEEALYWFEQVLRADTLRDFTVYATALTNAAACYSRLGQFERALALHQEALAIHEQRGARTYLMQALNQIGVLYTQQDRPREALPYLQRALEIAQESRVDAQIAVQAGNLAEAHALVGEWDAAERFNDLRRQAAGEGGRRSAHASLTAARIALGRNDPARARELYLESRALADSPATRWNAEYGLAEVALALGDAQNAARHFEGALAIIEDTRAELLATDFQISFLAPLIGFYRSYVDMLVAQGKIEHALSVAESSRGRILAAGQGAQAGALVNAAAFRNTARVSGRTLLSFWLAPERSYVWAVTASAVHVSALPPAGAIEALVREHRAAIEGAFADPLRDASSAGDRLHATLVAPLSPWIAGSSIVIVPDGALHGLNFETLPAIGENGRRGYWLEQVEIQIAPSLAMLSRSSETVNGDRQRARVDASRQALLLVGDPEAQGQEFPRLRFAAQEMNGVASHFDEAAIAVFKGPQASPSGYRDAAPQRFQLIHFTAHATANVDSPLDSAVILSGPPDRFRLSARDVAEIPLNAELVTVSACRSAGERAYSGEGLIGFAWAFLRAGSKRVVAGLWDVDDRSTAALMNSFYARLATGMRPAQALREAKLELIRSGVTKPYYWGPLQMFTVVP